MAFHPVRSRQCGLIASPAVSIQHALRNRFGYPWARMLFEGIVITLLIVIFALGTERKSRNFRSKSTRRSNSPCETR
jgi:hypothetical protein